MRLFTDLELDVVRRLDGLLFDVDDTLLTHGALSDEARSALTELIASPLRAVAVTGRSVQRGQSLLDEWALTGVVAENGAADVLPGVGGSTTIHDPDSQSRASRRSQLLELVAELQERFAELTPARDAEERLSDFTFDIGEYRSVQPAVVEAASQVVRRRGGMCTRSSIHLHVSFDAWDKASGVLRFAQRHLKLDPTRTRYRFAYVGDSQNDAPCFAAFEHSIGVQNLSGQPTVLPRFRTLGAFGAGFAEVVAHLLRAARSYV